MIRPGHIVASIGGFDGTIESTDFATFDPSAAPNVIISQVAGVLRNLVQRNIDGRPIVGIGISIPGIVDLLGHVARIATMPSWKDISIGQLVEDELEIPVFVENESRVQAVAEGWLGGAVGSRHFICLEAGLGVCAGVVINGELWRGVHSLAGEIGRQSVVSVDVTSVPVEAATSDTTPSIRELLTTFAPTLDFPSSATQHMDIGTSLKDLRAAAEAGDEAAIRAISQYADKLAARIGGLIVAYDPEKIFIHGQAILLGEPLIALVRKRVHEYFEKLLDLEVSIEATTLGTEAALVGSANLALHGAWGFTDPTAKYGGKVQPDYGGTA